MEIIIIIQVIIGLVVFISMAAIISEKNDEILELKKQLSKENDSYLKCSLMSIQYINANSNLKFLLDTFKELAPEDYKALEELAKIKRQENIRKMKPLYQ